MFGRPFLQISNHFLWYSDNFSSCLWHWHFCAALFCCWDMCGTYTEESLSCSEELRVCMWLPVRVFVSDSSSVDLNACNTDLRTTLVKNNFAAFFEFGWWACSKWCCIIFSSFSIKLFPMIDFLNLLIKKLPWHAWTWQLLAVLAATEWFQLFNDWWRIGWGLWLFLWCDKASCELLKELHSSGLLCLGGTFWHFCTINKWKKINYSKDKKWYE